MRENREDCFVDEFDADEPWRGVWRAALAYYAKVIIAMFAVATFVGLVWGWVKG